MKIYILERDNPQTRPEPEIFYSLGKAAETVEDEVKQVMKDLDITEEDLDNQYGYYETRDSNDVLYSASLVDEWSGERYDWRITEHDVDTNMYAEWVQKEMPEDDYVWAPWRCSNCNFKIGKNKTMYCPNCGADMRGEPK